MTQTLKAIQYVSDQEIKTGTTMVAFHWVIFVLGLVFSGGLNVIFVYERMGVQSYGNSEARPMTPQMERDDSGGGDEGGGSWS